MSCFKKIFSVLMFAGLSPGAALEALSSNYSPEADFSPPVYNDMVEGEETPVLLVEMQEDEYCWILIDNQDFQNPAALFPTAAYQSHGGGAAEPRLIKGLKQCPPRLSRLALDSVENKETQTAAVTPLVPVSVYLGFCIFTDYATSKRAIKHPNPLDEETAGTTFTRLFAGIVCFPVYGTSYLIRWGLD